MLFNNSVNLTNILTELCRVELIYLLVYGTAAASRTPALATALLVAHRLRILLLLLLLRTSGAEPLPPTTSRHGAPGAVPTSPGTGSCFRRERSLGCGEDLEEAVQWRGTVPTVWYCGGGRGHPFFYLLSPISGPHQCICVTVQCKACPFLIYIFRKFESVTKNEVYL
jgi:hypothetical protein